MKTTGNIVRVAEGLVFASIQKNFFMLLNIALWTIGIRINGRVGTCLIGRIHGLDSLTAMVTGK